MRAFRGIPLDDTDQLPEMIKRNLLESELADDARRKYKNSDSLRQFEDKIIEDDQYIHTHAWARFVKLIPGYDYMSRFKAIEKYNYGGCCWIGDTNPLVAVEEDGDGTLYVFDSGEFNEYLIKRVAYLHDFMFWLPATRNSQSVMRQMDGGYQMYRNENDIVFVKDW